MSELNNFSLFAANTIVLSVTAFAFFLAWKSQPGEHYWKSWFLANIVIALGLVVFMFEPMFPDLVVITVPNGLLILGLGLRWRAARQFGGRPSLFIWICGPSFAFITLCTLPWVFGSYGAIYTIVNVILTVQTVAIAYEFWRDRSDKLPSRYGLVAVYGLMALSFAGRVGQGLLFGNQMARHLPDDVMLTAHLTAALAFITASAAFAITIAYERGATSLRDAAMRDSLTGLYNRRAFEARIQECLADPEKGEFAIALFDIDHFKEVNDRYGHIVGDEVLRTCATLCRRSLREDDFLARIGGEEFAAILSDISAADAFEITDSVRQVVKTSILNIDGEDVMLTLSAGVCHSSLVSRNFDEMMKSVDACLYAAKDNGRDRVEQLAEQGIADLVQLRHNLKRPGWELGRIA